MNLAITAWIGEHLEATITLSQQAPYEMRCVTVALLDGRSCERLVHNDLLIGGPEHVTRAILDDMLRRATLESVDAG